MAVCSWIPWAIYGSIAVLLFGLFVHVAIHCRKCGGGWFAVSTGVGILGLFELFQCGDIIPVAFAALGMALFLAIGIALPVRKDDRHAAQLKGYFREALRREHALDDAREALVREGWPTPVVDNVARQFRKVSTPLATQEAERKVMKDIEYHLVQGMSKGLSIEEAAQALVRAGWPQALVQKQLMVQRGELNDGDYSVSADHPADDAPVQPPRPRVVLPRPKIPVHDDQNPDDDPLPEPEEPETPQGVPIVDPNLG